MHPFLHGHLIQKASEPLVSVPLPFHLSSSGLAGFPED